MKDKPISQMYIIGCDFSPFDKEKFKQDTYECVQVENGMYSNLIEKNSLLLPKYRNKIRIIAYRKDQLDQLEKEINILNEMHKDAKKGKYHFYIKKLNSGNNYFKLIPTKTSGNFHSQNKKLHGYYFDIKPTKSFKQTYPIIDLI